MGARVQPKVGQYFTGGKVTLRREMTERGGSHEVWYGGKHWRQENSPLTFDRSERFNRSY
jgi:hypothetical protein